MPQQTPNYNIIPIDNVIQSAENGHSKHWFSSNAKRFFKSKWNNVAYRPENSDFAYFISSEKHNDNPRLYTIRRINMKTGDINKPYPNEGIFQFQKYTTKNQALTQLRKYLKEGEPT